MATIDLTVPDLGGFEGVPVISVLVRPGDAIAKEAPLVELESDKATMEVPASAAGTVRDVKVKIGDKVSQGSVLVSVETADEAAPATVAAQPSASVAAAAGAAVPPAPGASDEAAELAEPDDTAATPPAGRAELAVPDLGGFADVPVIAVLVKAGDAIAKDAPLVELESDKATMEVPAATGGVVEDVLVKVGDKVSQGTVLATVATQTADVQPAAVRQPPPVSAPREEPAMGAPALAAVVAPVPPSRNGFSESGSAPPHASPAIRRFARELGVDLAAITGSGPNGRITRDDLQRFVKSALTEKPATVGVSAGGLQLLAWPKIDFARFGPVERAPLSRIQKISGPNLARNWVMIPHVTQNEDADVTELEAFRSSVNAENRNVKVTMLALLIKASVAALKKFPQFNSSLDGDELILKRYYHLGFAADTPNGLMVPVVKDADRKGLLEIARETAELSAKARDGKLSAADMSGASFTISSLGGIGGTYFTPIINAPEVAILGACRTAVRPVWNGNAFAPRTMLPLSLSYDHRVIDGASAARFAAYLAGVLADFRRVLL
ncbi:MAG: dihydrolipoyllysine-residue acetyltransferase [Candidatus Velthaea sp.]